MNKPFRVWQLQEAKARLSEVIRLAQTEGPQIVTVHGKVAVTIAKAPEGLDADAEPSGVELVKALRAGAAGLPDAVLPEWDTPGPFRDVDL